MREFTDGSTFRSDAPSVHGWPGNCLSVHMFQWNVPSIMTDDLSKRAVLSFVQFGFQICISNAYDTHDDDEFEHVRTES